MENKTIHKLSLRKNDQVQVMAGKEKGKMGKILSVSSASNRVTIEKINMVKRHMKPSQSYPQGGIIEKETPLHYSNVLLFCTKCNRGVRHGHKMAENSVEKKGKKAAAAGAKKQAKVRFCKRCETVIG